jgi:hypothetical protein
MYGFTFHRSPSYSSSFNSRQILPILIRPQSWDNESPASGAAISLPILVNSDSNPKLPKNSKVIYVVYYDFEEKPLWIIASIAKQEAAEALKRRWLEKMKLRTR